MGVLKPKFSQDKKRKICKRDSTYPGALSLVLMAMDLVEIFCPLKDGMKNDL